MSNSDGSELQQDGVFDQGGNLPLLQGSASSSSTSRPPLIRGREPDRRRGNSATNRSDRNSTSRSIGHMWKLLREQTSYQFVYEEDLRSILTSDKLAAHFKSVQDKTRQRVRFISPSNCFMYLADQAITTLLEWVNLSQQGVNGTEIQKWEFLAWIAQHMFSGLMPYVSADQCDRYLKSNNVPITISQERYNEIFALLTPFDPELNAQSTGSGVDDVLKLRELMHLAFTKSFQIFVDEHFCGTKDDELIRSDAYETMQHSEGKCKRWCIKSDVIASMSRAIVAVRYHEHQYKQEIAVREMLDSFAQNCASFGIVTSKEMSINCGYTAEYIWKKCANHGIGCNFIVDEKRLLRHPIAGGSQSAAMKLPPKYCVGDDVRYGDAIFSAVKLYKHKSRSVANRTKVMALAVRQRARTRNNEKKQVPHIRRFIVSDNPNAKLLSCTYTLVPRPKLTNTEQDLVLFYPDAYLENNPDKAATESYLRQVIHPLTASQRTADWFLLRRFRVTGRMAARIAMKDPRANLLLSSAAERNELMNRFKDGETSLEETQGALSIAKSQGTVVPSTQFDETESQVTDIRSDSSGASNNDFDDVLFSDTASVSSVESRDEQDDQLSDLNSSDSDLSSCSEDEAGGLPLLFDDDVCEADQKDYEYLVNSWFGRSFNRTEARRNVNVNKGRVVVSLRMCRWVKLLFEIGLMAKKNKPWLAVSADGFAKIIHPTSKSSVSAAVAIKETKARSGIEATQSILDEYGSYFSCVVGDDTWWKAVPPEYRGKVIHHAVVLGVKHVLFVVATQTTITYCCVVEVSEETCQTFESALDRYETFLAWPHLGHNEPPNSLHLNCGLTAVLESNIPLWRSMVKFIENEKKVCKPLKALRAAVAMNYPIQKDGMDGDTQFIEQFCNKFVTHNWEQNVAVRTLRQLLVNSHIMYRITTNFNLDTFSTSDKFMEKCNEDSLSFTEFVEKVSVGLLVMANAQRLEWVNANTQRLECVNANTQRLSRGNTNPQRLARVDTNPQRMARGDADAQQLTRVTANAQQLEVVHQRVNEVEQQQPIAEAQNSTANEYNYSDFRYPGRNRLSYFNRGIGKLVRLDLNAEHLTGIVPDKKRKRCVVCENPTRNVCTRCKAPLCLYRVTKRKCFHCFHVKDTVSPEDANRETSENGNVLPNQIEATMG